MKLLTVTYNSLLWSLLLATFLFNYTWLQMRVNIGYLFFALWLVLIILWELALRRHPVKRGFTVVSALLTIAIALLVEGRENLLVIPGLYPRGAPPRKYFIYQYQPGTGGNNYWRLPGRPVPVPEVPLNNKMGAIKNDQNRLKS